MENFRNKIKDVASIGVADITMTGISAIFWFYVASIVEPDNYGQITYFISIAMLSSTIVLFGASNTNIVYTAKKIPIQPALYSITLSSGIMVSSIVFFIFINIGASALIFGLIIFGLTTSELLGRKLFREYSKFVLSQRSLLVIFGIGLYYLIGNDGILIGYVMSYMPYSYLIIRSFRTEKIHFDLVKDRLHFMIPQYFQTLSGSKWLIRQIDNCIIIWI